MLLARLKTYSRRNYSNSWAAQKKHTLHCQKHSKRSPPIPKFEHNSFFFNTKQATLKPRLRFWPKLRRTIGLIPFTDDLLAAYYCATDRTTPAYVKAVLLAALAYFVVPTDLIPDFIAAFGYTDDASVLAGAIAAVHRHISPAHRARAAAYLERRESGGDPQSPA